MRLKRGQSIKNSSQDTTTRAQIVAGADDLFYRHGFEKTSFTDIADQVGISRGNFYYHFKSKDDILAAVIERRAASTQAMLDGWAGEAEDPRERLRSFARMLIRNRGDIQHHGCPVGTLCSELSKLEHPAQSDAAMIFLQFRRWLALQFSLWGYEEAQADMLSMHLLGRSQGIASLANAFRNESFIRREVELIESWLDSLAPQVRKTPSQASRRKVRLP